MGHPSNLEGKPERDNSLMKKPVMGEVSYPCDRQDPLDMVKPELVELYEACGT
jgi:hypothetical protein